MISQEEFLIQHLTQDKSYQVILNENEGFKGVQLSEWWEEGQELKSVIKKSNQLFASKQKIKEFSEFKRIGKRGFYEWYLKQPKLCYYCKIEEFKMKELFDKDLGPLKTKRQRGRFLELERRDAITNMYSPDNCVLVCYLCNNHKSDLISEKDHVRYFAPAIKTYLEDKYKQVSNIQSFKI